MDTQDIQSKLLCSVADAMAFCEAGTTKFDQVAALCMVATRDIEQATNRAFSPQTVPLVEIFSTRQTRSTGYDWASSLEASPSIHSGTIVTSRSQSFQLMGVNVDLPSLEVRYDPYSQFGADTILQPGADFYLEGDTLVVERGTQYRPRALRASYMSGFPVIAAVGQEPDRLTVPEELRVACLMQVAHLRTRTKPDNVGMSGDRKNSGKDRIISFGFAVTGGIPPEVQSLVARYRRTVFGRG